MRSRIAHVKWLAVEYLGPFVEFVIRGHNDRLSLLAFGYHLEEKLRSLFGESRVADFVYDQRFEIG